MAGRVAGFFERARESLDLALYDVRLPDPVGSIVADELRAAPARGVAIRLIYNVDSERPAALHPPPQTRPEILEELPIEARAISGVPDLMHHKYVVRDGEAVWTGSANWTVDSWSRQENVLAIVEDAQLGERFAAQLRRALGGARRRAQRLRRARALEVGGARSRHGSRPGHGEELSQRVATLIGGARERVRIASPVLTSGPVLATLNELAERGRCDVAGVVDGPQVATVFEQWAENAQQRLEDPAAARDADEAPLRRQALDPVAAGRRRPRLHAREADRRRRHRLPRLLQPLALGRAERREHARDPRSRSWRAAWRAFVDEIRGRYPAAVAAG